MFETHLRGQEAEVFAPILRRKPVVGLVGCGLRSRQRPDCKEKARNNCYVDKRRARAVGKREHATGYVSCYGNVPGQRLSRLHPHQVAGMRLGYDPDALTATKLESVARRQR